MHNYDANTTVGESYLLKILFRNCPWLLTALLGLGFSVACNPQNTEIKIVPTTTSGRVEAVPTEQAVQAQPTIAASPVPVEAPTGAAATPASQENSSTNNPNPEVTRIPQAFEDYWNTQGTPTPESVTITELNDEVFIAETGTEMLIAIGSQVTPVKATKINAKTNQDGSTTIYEFSNPPATGVVATLTVPASAEGNGATLSLTPEAGEPVTNPSPTEEEGVFEEEETERAIEWLGQQEASELFEKVKMTLLAQSMLPISEKIFTMPAQAFSDYDNHSQTIASLTENLKSELFLKYVEEIFSAAQKDNAGRVVRPVYNPETRIMEEAVINSNNLNFVIVPQQGEQNNIFDQEYFTFDTMTSPFKAILVNHNGEIYAYVEIPSNSQENVYATVPFLFTIYRLLNSEPGEYGNYTDQTTIIEALNKTFSETPEQESNNRLTDYLRNEELSTFPLTIEQSPELLLSFIELTSDFKIFKAENGQIIAKKETERDGALTFTFVILNTDQTISMYQIENVIPVLTTTGETEYTVSGTTAFRLDQETGLQVFE